MRVDRNLLLRPVRTLPERTSRRYLNHGYTISFAALVPVIVKVGQERQAQDGTAKGYLPKDIERGLSPR